MHGASMKKILIADGIPMAFAIAGVVSLMYLWLSADAAVSLKERLPGGDNKPANAGAGDERCQDRRHADQIRWGACGSARRLAAIPGAQLRRHQP